MIPRRKLPLYGLVLAYGISQLGTLMSGLAIPWLVLVTTGSAARTGLVGFAEMAPYVVAQAISGPVVDRFGLRRSCVTGNAAAAVLVGAIPALYALGALSLGSLFAVVAVAGAVRGAADAATSPLVPREPPRSAGYRTSAPPASTRWRSAPACSSACRWPAS